MHIEFLIEDKSGKESMEIMKRKLVDDNANCGFNHFKSVGHIPKNLKLGTANTQSLLGNLPKLLQGYANTPGYDIIVVICDLDNRNKEEFLSELNGILANCNPKPNTIFCIAVKEFEAWYLGDVNAVLAAYPNANHQLLNEYHNEEIFGTWKTLADYIKKGESTELKYPLIGERKSEWAKKNKP